jgi:hypothetical protein
MNDEERDQLTPDEVAELRALLPVLRTLSPRAAGALTPEKFQCLITMERMGQAAGWPTRRIQRLLVGAKAADKIDGRWYTTRELLQRRLPRTYVSLWARLDMLDEHDAGDQEAGDR